MSSYAGMSSASSQRQMMRVEMMWHGQDNINRIIQFNFFVDNSSYFIDSTSSAELIRRKDKYI